MATSLYDLRLGQKIELDRILAEAGLDAEMAEALLRQPALAGPMIRSLREQLSVGRFDRYARLLSNLGLQFERLRRLDEVVWGGRVAAAGWFDDVDTSSDHVQSVQDLEFLYVSFGSMQEDFDLHWKAVAANQQVDSSNGCYIATGPGNLRLHPFARTYEPGIHRVRINLVANWEPQDGRTLIQVRERVPGGCYLAAAEVLAADALHSELLREADGQNFPFQDLAGAEYRFPDDRDFTHCPYVGRDGDGVKLDAGWIDYSDREFSAPLVLGVQN